MDSNTQNIVNYNESLRKVCSTKKTNRCLEITQHQISNSLQNALNTFGASSRQYQAILEILKECLRDIESESGKQSKHQAVDEDMLTTAMGFLDIGK